jgi:ATP-dependent RNA helicase RhlE
VRLDDIEKLIKIKIEQVVVPGFEPGAAPIREGREERAPRHGHMNERRERERSRDERRPRSEVRLPAPASHLPKVAADGFDFSKPYESKQSAAGETSSKPEVHPRRPVRPVAALLGGLIKK